MPLFTAFRTRPDRDLCIQRTGHLLEDVLYRDPDCVRNRAQDGVRAALPEQSATETLTLWHNIGQEAGQIKLGVYNKMIIFGAKHANIENMK
jgi:hypothetical protein